MMIAEYRALAATAESIAQNDYMINGSYLGDGQALLEVAAALREAAEMREWMQLIYDYDDGAWAAGRSHEAARKQGITTMRGMAACALRGESVIGGAEP